MRIISGCLLDSLCVVCRIVCALFVGLFVRYLWVFLCVICWTICVYLSEVGAGVIDGEVACADATDGH